MHVLSAGVKSAIRLRDIALLLAGSLLAGAGLGFIGILVTRAFTDSNFAAEIAGGITFYGAWLLGYEWLAKDQRVGSGTHLERDICAPAR